MTKMIQNAHKEFAAADYKSPLRPVWCAGCGNYGILKSMIEALVELQIDPDELMFSSGIGCASRFPYFVNGYALHGVHGRALPVAVGMKTARPDLTTIVVGGDGDGFSIGGGHVPHVARKNVDITYVVANNSVYGLTKGQTSPTSGIGQRTTTSPMGVVDPPVNPIMYLLGADASFVARGFTGETKELTRLIVEAVRHPGFAVVEALSPCPSFNKVMTFKALRERIAPVPEAHDPADRRAALDLALDEGKLYTGLFYKYTRPTYDQNKAEIETRAGLHENERGGLESLMVGFA